MWIPLADMFSLLTEPYFVKSLALCQWTQQILNILDMDPAYFYTKEHKCCPYTAPCTVLFGKIFVFWNVRLCSPVCQSTYAWIYHFHLQGKRGAEQNTRTRRPVFRFTRITFRPWRWTTYVPPKHVNFYRTARRRQGELQIRHVLFRSHMHWGSISDPVTVKFAKVPLFQNLSLIFIFEGFILLRPLLQSFWVTIIISNHIHHIHTGSGEKITKTKN
jgi:hypothetical protein